MTKIDIAVIGGKNSHKTKIIKFWLSLGSNTAVQGAVYSKIFWVENNPLHVDIHKISEISEFTINYHAIVYVCRSVTDIDTVFALMDSFAKNDCYQCTILLDHMPSNTLFNKDLYCTSLDNESLLPILSDITMKAFKQSHITFDKVNTVLKETAELFEDNYVELSQIDTDCCRLL